MHFSRPQASNFEARDGLRAPARAPRRMRHHRGEHRSPRVPTWVRSSLRTPNTSAGAHSVYQCSRASTALRSMSAASAVAASRTRGRDVSMAPSQAAANLETQRKREARVAAVRASNHRRSVRLQCIVAHVELNQRFAAPYEVDERGSTADANQICK